MLLDCLGQHDHGFPGHALCNDLPGFFPASGIAGYLGKNDGHVHGDFNACMVYLNLFSDVSRSKKPGIEKRDHPSWIIEKKGMSRQGEIRFAIVCHSSLWYSYETGS